MLGILDKFRQIVYIDVGSSRIRMALSDKGVIVDEANLVARIKQKRWIGVNAPRRTKTEVVVWGDRASKMQYLEPAHIEVIAPLVSGVVVDVESLVLILVRAMAIIMEVPSAKVFLLKPKFVAAVGGMSLVERRALSSAMYLAGAGVVELENSIVVRKKMDYLVVDIGYGKTQVGLCSQDGLVVEKIGKFGGKDIDSALQFYTKMRYGVAIGQKAAERLKHGFSGEGESVVVQGKNLGTGMPEAISIRQTEVAEALNLEMAKLVRLIRQAMEDAPEGYADKMAQKGIILTGGGAKLVGLLDYLAQELKMPVKLVDDPVYDLIYSLYL